MTVQQLHSVQLKKLAALTLQLEKCRETLEALREIQAEEGLGGGRVRAIEALINAIDGSMTVVRGEIDIIARCSSGAV